MLAGVSLSDVIVLLGRGHTSWSKILEALDSYGISYASKAVYTKNSSYQLPLCCIVNNDNRFLLLYNGSFCGVADVDPKKTISYIEVFTENKKKKSREDSIYEELGEIRDTINDKKIEAFKRLETSRQQSEGRFDYEKEREEGINAKYGL